VEDCEMGIDRDVHILYGYFSWIPVVDYIGCADVPNIHELRELRR